MVAAVFAVAVLVAAVFAVAVLVTGTFAVVVFAVAVLVAATFFVTVLAGAALVEDALVAVFFAAVFFGAVFFAGAFFVADAVVDVRVLVAATARWAVATSSVTWIPCSSSERNTAFILLGLISACTNATRSCSLSTEPRVVPIRTSF